jgi:hypothetical protein
MNTGSTAECPVPALIGLGWFDVVNTTPSIMCVKSNEKVDTERSGLDAEYVRLFTNMVAEPLNKVIGKPFLAAVYYVLHPDFLNFDAEAPNLSGGCQSVHLTFEDGELELDWDWLRVFRLSAEDKSPEEQLSPRIAYHLVARSTSERQATVREFTEEDVSGLGAINATTSLPWKAVQGELLQGVTLWGSPLAVNRNSPQAVCLQFPSGEIVVAIGMSTPLSIGDGDEVLVFTGAEWTQRLAEQPNQWLTPFWWLSAKERTVFPK